MSRRIESEIQRLSEADLDLRTRITPQLTIVAGRKNTDFFMRNESEFLAEARDILRRAQSLSQLAEQLAASRVVAAFEEANDLQNEQRLGPIRLAERLLRELNERG